MRSPLVHHGRAGRPEMLQVETAEFPCIREKTCSYKSTNRCVREHDMAKQSVLLPNTRIHVRRQKSTVYEQHHSASLAKIEQLWPTAWPPVDVAMCTFGRDFAMPTCSGGHSDNRCPAPAADGSLHGCSQRHVTWLRQAVTQKDRNKERRCEPKNAVVPEWQ